MDISPIADEHYNRTSHGSHPLLQMKQGFNSAMQFFIGHKRMESEMESEEIQ